MSNEIPDQQRSESLAIEAIDLQKSISELSKKLDDLKSQLRILANEREMKIVIAGHGQVNVYKPKIGGVVTGTKLTLNEDKLNTSLELKNRLIEKGIIVKTDIISTPAIASVVIKPNV